MMRAAISAASWGVNRLDVFATGADSQIYHKAWDGAAWLPSPTLWEPLGGVFNGPPAAVSWGSNRVDIVARGADNQIYHKSFDGNTWLPSPTDWEPLGGAFNSPPAIAAWGSNRLDIVAVGGGNQMYHKAWDGSAWLPSPTGWEPLGGALGSPPAIASWGSNRLDIFALGARNQMYHKAWDGKAWVPGPPGWEPLGGLFTSPPAVASWGTNRLDIFALGPRNQMLHKAWDGKQWLPSPIGWDDLGGAFNSPPAVVSWGANRLDIFGLGTDNQMYHKAWDGKAWLPSQAGWEPIGGLFGSAPAAVSWGSGHLDIFALDADYQMSHKAGDGKTWLPSPTAWEPLGWFAYCNCDQCPENPAVACSFTGQEVAVNDIYLANAYKGHLILSPGDAGGFIGGLLHELQPQQHYSHMGIMVSDFSLIRHATASLDRLLAEEYFTGTVFGVVPAPTDGFNHDHVRYQWPGTITQSIEQAFIADRYGANPPGATGPYTGANLPDKESAQGSTFPIKAMSFETIVEGGRTFPALVVKPCPLLESDPVRQAVEAIADSVMEIYSHYRFYTYTDGFIANDPNFWSLPTSVIDAHVDWDPVIHKWVDWSDQTKLKWTSPIPTLPLVCSAFIWQAVWMLNEEAKKSMKPPIELDSVESSEPGDVPGCIRAVPPDFSGDVVDSATLQGLYFYNEGERQQAGQHLHDKVAQAVWDKFKTKAPFHIGVALDNIGGREAFAAAATVGPVAVQLLLAPYTQGIDLVLAEQLIEALYDMPEDIANQMCNCFAFDCCNGWPGDSRCVDAKGNKVDLDSDNWKSAPGVGRTVSPDNIHMYWDRPVRANVDGIVGLYGYNRPVQPVVGVTMRPVCALVPSTGTATLYGFVKYKGANIRGAYVKAGCEHTITPGIDQVFTLQVRSGANYRVVARYEDPATGKTLYGQKSTQDVETVPVVQPGSSVNMGEITLLDPPQCMRNIIVTGYIRTDDVHTGGANHDEVHYQKVLYVQAGVPKYDEVKGWTCDTSDANNSRLEDYCEVTSDGTSAVAVLHIDVRLDPDPLADLSVLVTLTGTLNPDEDNMKTTKTVSVPKDLPVSYPEFDLDTGGNFPDRAYFRDVQIINQATNAI